MATLPESKWLTMLALLSQLNPKAGPIWAWLAVDVHVENGFAATDVDEAVSSTETKYGR